MKKFNIVKKCVIFGMILGAVITATSCLDNNTSSNNDDKLIVAVSIVPEQTFVEAVCGDLADVVTLIPSGSSPESYEPTARQMEDFSDSKVYFSIGVPTEESNILPNVGDVEVVSLADEVSKEYEDRTFEDGERDPHIWLSPKRVIVIVKTIADKMSEIDPDNKEIYEANAQNYIEELETLDGNITDTLANVENRAFIVYHPSFGYFADDYDLEMYALEEEGKEATVSELQKKIDIANEKGIKAIFYQEEIDSSQSEAFAEEIGGKTIQLEPLSADYINNLEKMAQTIAEVMK